MNKLEDVIEYGENVAAITAMIHDDPKVYQELYDKIADGIGGFVGIWNFCAEIAKVFTIVEAPYTAGEDFYRIEAIECFTNDII